jgi:predicted small secreted protein
MKYITVVVLTILFSGCATWNGIKQDTKTGVDWTKSKVHEGAVYIEKKTQ